MHARLCISCVVVFYNVSFGSSRCCAILCFGYRFRVRVSNMSHCFCRPTAFKGTLPLETPCQLPLDAHCLQRPTALRSPLPCILYFSVCFLSGFGFGRDRFQSPAYTPTAHVDTFCEQTPDPHPRPYKKGTFMFCNMFFCHVFPIKVYLCRSPSGA